jgi:hypothetical protein
VCSLTESSVKLLFYNIRFRKEIRQLARCVNATSGEDFLTVLKSVRECIQKFPDWVDNEIYAYDNKHSLRSNTKGYGNKTLTRLTHKIAIQLHLVAERCIICSSRSRRPIRKLLHMTSYFHKKRQISSGSGRQNLYHFGAFFSLFPFQFDYL